MFGKLLKYDFRSVAKQFAIIWPAALVMALVSRLTLMLSNSAAGDIEAFDNLSDAISMIAVSTYIIIIVAMSILSTVFIILRFYKGLLRDEGYLMHTLPVPTWQLICSKLVSAVAVQSISAVVALLSILLLIPLSPGELIEMVDYVLEDAMSAMGGHLPLLVVELLLVMLLGSVSSCLYYYTSMAIGHLFGKNRIIMSVVAYVGISCALNAVSVFLMVAALPMFLSERFSSIDPAMAFHAVMWVVVVLSAVLAGVFFFVTEYILHKKLNLE